MLANSAEYSIQERQKFVKGQFIDDERAAYRELPNSPPVREEEVPAQLRAVEVRRIALRY
jgi:hypothetical protein